MRLMFLKPKFFKQKKPPFLSEHPIFIGVELEVGIVGEAFDVIVVVIVVLYVGEVVGPSDAGFLHQAVRTHRHQR